MEKMLVTQALNELKTLDSRINRAISAANFVSCSKKAEKNATPGVTKEEFCENAKASKQSIEDLIKRRETIKAAIIQSNAVTEIEICGQKMTVAKAIDTKESIGYYLNLLNHMKQEYLNVLATYNNANAMVNSKIDQLILAAYGKDGKDKISESDYNAIASPYKAANEVELVDPIHIKDEIEKLESYIDDFTSNVDAQLQISNCVTYIKI